MSPDLNKQELSKTQRVRKISGVAGAIAVCLVLLLVGIPFLITSRADFFAGYSGLKSYYRGWSESSHKDVACSECHTSPGLFSTAGYRARAVGEFYREMMTTTSAAKPQLTNFGKPTSEACFACHGNEGEPAMLGPLKVPHLAHIDVAQETRDCVGCHKWVGHKEAYQAKHKKLPLNAVCLDFGCHAGTAQKDKCSNCHHRATTSEAQWRVVHKDAVNDNGQNNCFDYCHDSDYCRKCHTTGQKPTDGATAGTAIQPGDLISKHANSTHWMNKHGEVAVIDASKCLNCHISMEYCNSCHKKRPASHGKKERWMAAHKKVVKRESDKGCLACHQRKTCDKCHELFKEKGL